MVEGEGVWPSRPRSLLQHPDPAMPPWHRGIYVRQRVGEASQGFANPAAGVRIVQIRRTKSIGNHVFEKWAISVALLWLMYDPEPYVMCHGSHLETSFTSVFDRWATLQCFALWLRFPY
jgi:hypothetical protein